MYVPKLHNRKGWQRFFVGMFFGIVFGYLTMLYIYGSLQEKILEEQLELTSKIKELERQNKSLISDKEDLDELRKQETTITDIEIHIMNKEKLKIDRLLRYQLEEVIIEEIEHLIGKSVESIASNDELLISTIENKIFTVEDFSYEMQVSKLIISKKIKIEVKATLPKK